MMYHIPNLHVAQPNPDSNGGSRSNIGPMPVLLSWRWQNVGPTPIPIWDHRTKIWFSTHKKDPISLIDGLVQERHNSIANALELCLSCTYPSIFSQGYIYGVYFVSIIENTGSVLILLICITPTWIQLTACNQLSRAGLVRKWQTFATHRQIIQQPIYFN